MSLLLFVFELQNSIFTVKTHMKYFFLLACVFFTTLSVQAQTPGPEETKLSTAICDCLKQLDFNTIKTKQQAEAAFADIFKGLRWQRI